MIENATDFFSFTFIITLTVNEEIGAQILDTLSKVKMIPSYVNIWLINSTENIL